VFALLRETEGGAEQNNPTGEFSHVNIALAGLGSKRILVANLTPDVANNTLRATLAPYDKIMDIHNEKWFKDFKYIVKNGVRQVTMCLNQHVPFHLTIAGQRVPLSYEGQPATCNGCEEEGNTYQGC
jgi:hypothetical protein